MCRFEKERVFLQPTKTRRCFMHKHRTGRQMIDNLFNATCAAPDKMSFGAGTCHTESRIMCSIQGKAPSGAGSTPTDEP